jgi:hypothetical protein
MALDPAAVTRASRALRGYSMSEDAIDRGKALDALMDLLVLAEMAGDTVAAGQLHEALEIAGLGPAGANEADNMLAEFANRPSQ